MNSKEKTYWDCWFPPHVIRAARAKFVGQTTGKSDHIALQIEMDGAAWDLDDEGTFFARYGGSSKPYARLYHSRNGGMFQVYYWPTTRNTLVTVRLETVAQIEDVFSTFEEALSSSRLPALPKAAVPPPPKPTIFIGHGHDTQWRDLKDHLHEQHGYLVEAFETGARAGHSTRDVLESMLAKSSFALLVLTGEDETSDGQMRARQNVIHEAGLFQGKLGFKRAIMLVEKGIEDFSNVDSIQQIRFDKGHINGTYGEVLAVLRREFT